MKQSAKAMKKDAGIWIWMMRAIEIFIGIRLGLGVLALILILMGSDVVLNHLTLGLLQIDFVAEFHSFQLDRVTQCLLVIGDLLETICLFCMEQYAIRIFQSLEKERPFSFSNAKRMRRIGECIFFYGFSNLFSNLVLQVIVSRLCGVGLFNADIVSSTESSSPLNIPVFLIGGVVFVMAEVFRYGAKLQKESDETL